MNDFRVLSLMNAIRWKHGQETGQLYVVLLAMVCYEG